MKSQAMIKQINELYDKGHSIRKISLALGVSRNTVRKHLNNEEKQTIIENQPRWHTNYDWDLCMSELNKGATVKQIFSETLPPISYKRFCSIVASKRKQTPEVAPRIPHAPGEKVFVDFCDGPPITCPKTGNKIKTEFFCGVLPFSSLTYGVFVKDQKLPTFLRCHESMWQYFGGVTPYVVPDNLKSAVKKAHTYDPDKNQTYCDFGNHFGFAVLPARPYSPRDKASVETGIGVIQRTFYQEIRNQTFYSIAELNEYFRVFLDKFNNGVMKDYGVSRRDRFEKEKNLLLPLPSGSYDIVEWKTAKVHPDCCVQVNNSFYSVPFQYVSQLVRVKIGDKLLEIYSENLEAIACHIKSAKIGGIRIDEKHLPPWAMQNSRFEVQKCLQAASLVGPKNHELMKSWFSDTHPLQYLRRAQGILRLYKENHSKEALEYAASQVMTFRKNRLSYYKHCAEAFSKFPKPQISSLPRRDLTTVHLHKGD